MGNEREFASDDPRIRELRSLRGQRGLTLAKVEKCEALLAEMQLTPLDLMAAIRDELSRMSNQVPVNALRYAYAVRDEAGGTLKARRAALRKSLPVSERRSDDAHENWENDSIDELLKRLLLRKTRRPASAHYIIVATAVFNQDQNLASFREEHLTDHGHKTETVSSQSWVDDDGEGGIDTGRTFYYECPRIPDESVQVHPVMVQVLFSPMLPPPARVTKREGATLREAQVAHSVELPVRYQPWYDDHYHYGYGTLLDSPPAGWVVAFFAEHPSSEGEEHQWRIWRKMGVDIRTGLQTSEELPLELDTD